MEDDAEWDEHKRRSNLARHGIDFIDAAAIFYGSFIEVEDVRSDYGERRFRALGQTGAEVLLVVYTWREQRRRIISAWRVGNVGRRRYQALFARPD